ncbi:AAA family ATPase [Candidatus Pacearchaeota archaeon]|nr:AAA family ATPase [Candidatus Pacearchaeota archaeon]
MTFIKRLVMHGFKSFPRKTELPFTQGINVILGPNGSGKCVVGETLVSLGENTNVRIDEIVNSRLSKSVKTEDGYLIPGDGTEVACLNINTLKVEKAKIKSFVKRTSPDKLLMIKTRFGREIKATKYHPLFILKEGKVLEARADELKEGIRIAVPRHINYEPEHKYFTELIDLIIEETGIYVPYKEEFKQILNSIKDNLTWKELAEELGVSYYVLKGLLDKQAINFHHLIKIMRFAKLSDLEIVSLIDEIVSNGKKTKFSFLNSPEFSRFLGYILAEGRLANSSQIWFTNGTREIVEDYVRLVRLLFGKDPLVAEYKPNCWDVIIYSEPLKKILSKLGMASKTENKFISNMFFKHSSNDEVSNLLNGLYCGDGYVSKSSIEITTKSPKLARGIESCLLRLGILFSTKDQVKGIKSSGFLGQYKNIIITGVENFKLFDDNILLTHKSKQQRIKEYLNKIGNTNADLIELNGLVKNIVNELNINVKKTKKQFPILDAYCYDQCTPSRQGLRLLSNSLFLEKTSLVNQLNLFVNSDIFWDEILEINEIDGVDWVYDLCVDTHHNFIANNIFVHNSNISDALCFVLGRLSMKSMRATKTPNLIFLGTKDAAPSKEASVEVVFDNTHKVFFIEKPEISIKRIVRRNGQSIYKINEETKTRQEVLSLLAQAGIDPNGFNIILQGEIQNFVNMHTEERRKIIEEVSGIAVYETRKEKSLRELEKTDEKLKEVLAILRERTTYLDNLEKERQQALKFKKLESEARRFKASIIYADLTQNRKEVQRIIEELGKKNIEIERVKKYIASLKVLIENNTAKISSINSTIQQSTGLEQEKLNQEIANIRAELAGTSVKVENYELKLKNLAAQKQELEKTIREDELELKELQRDVGKSIKGVQQKDIEAKKSELEALEEIRKKFYTFKSELKSIKDRIDDKKSLAQNYDAEAEFLVKQIKTIANELFDKESDAKKLEALKISLSEKKTTLEEIAKKEKELEKISSNKGYEIEKQKKLMEKIPKTGICPLCRSKITEDHVHNISREASGAIDSLNEQVGKLEKELKETYSKKTLLIAEIEKLSLEISKRESDLVKLESIEDKKSRIKNINEKSSVIKADVVGLEKVRNRLENNITKDSNIEQKYETVRVEFQELSIRNDENIDSEVSFKQRELERARISLKQLFREEKELESDLAEEKRDYEDKEELLNKKKEQEEILSKKFQRLISERDALQSKIREIEMSIVGRQNEIHKIEGDSNELKIEKARFDASVENLETEMLSYPNIEVIKTSKETLASKLTHVQEILNGIGSVNMRALEVYDSVKKEYDSVKERVDIIEKEKNSVMRIVHEIDVRKKKTFLKTLDSLNEIFSRNFSHLSYKGHVSLELENRKDPFLGGVNIIVKMGHGKYFDVKSLSGGEQTLVALALIFAIQEHKPYYFYILDEIDAALDKRNSERLAGLLRKYMQKGQYIVITHNDEVISNATNLYGVSMHDGISKIVSLKI